MGVGICPCCPGFGVLIVCQSTSADYGASEAAGRLQV
jgi:hypothetical protein